MIYWCKRMSDVSAVPSAPVPVPVAAPKPVPWYSWRRLGLNFLTISILAHVLFGVVATYLVVQVIQPKKKSFASGAPANDASKRAVEHKVSLARQKSSAQAPAAIKRVVTTGVSKVSLPSMPAMPTDSAVTPVSMSGMSGSAVGLGGFGNGMGGGSGGGGGGGGRSLFGLRGSGKGLKGTFYDLKQTQNKRPTTIKDVGGFVHQLDLFLQGGWNEGLLNQYYRAPTPLYTTQIFVPFIASVEAPKAFGVEKEVQPSLWMALYKGQVSPPESGTYYFVGGGDNILIVRLNGQVVLDKSWTYQELFGIDRGWQPTAVYDYKFGKLPKGFNRGKPVEMKAGEFYNMEILLGDDGGSAFFSLLVEKEGVEYTKRNGLPILPIFRMSQDPPPPGDQPPFQPGGPVWQSREAPVPTL